MQKRFILGALILLSELSFSQTPIQQASDKARETLSSNKKSELNQSPSLLVNPFVGTGGHGHTFPGAVAPFGMIQLSPDTRNDDWDGSSGYHYSDNWLYGFSHTHLSGTGVPDYCDVVFMPQSGSAKLIPGYKEKNGYGYRFSHDFEKASPGYYEVNLKENGINVRLTVTERAGIHEYTFENESEKKYVLIDLDPRDKVLAANANKLNNTEVSGFRQSDSWAKNESFFFHCKSSVPFKKVKRIFKKGKHKLLIEFPKSTKTVQLKVGISFVDEKAAKNNLEQEIGNKSFDEVRAETVKKWNQELGKIKVNSRNETEKSIFYTALYHAFIAPNVFSDVDGRYRGRDNQIHSLPAKNEQYTVFSLWDTYRGANPLFTLIQQKRTEAFIRTFLRQFDEGGDLPVWELAGNETECMIGYHSVSVIADAYVKGLKDFDTTKALKAMIATSNFDEYGKRIFREKGFLSASEEPESVSKTLEYAYDDFCIAQMAKAMKNDSATFAYTKSSYNFLNLFDPKTGFMRARRGAQWYGHFEPSEVNFNYTEANSWQYSLYAPQHIEVLTNLLGGKDSLERWLDRLFTTNSKLSGREQADITGLIGQYAHGNEPSHHMAYLYNYTNAPYKTQKYVQQIQTEMYQNAPDGLAGNEDCGQMSAWYVLSAMGFYPISPGNPTYQIGHPLFEEMELKLENGKSFKIKANNWSPENKYVKSIQLNGETLEGTSIQHQQIMNGGTLTFEMSSEIPLLEEDKRIQFFDEKVPVNIVPAPFVTVENRVFEDKLKVGIDFVKIAPSDGYFIFYSIDSTTWNNYEAPFFIDKSCRVYMKLQRRSENRKVNFSPVVWADFIKKDPQIHLKLSSEYANQYAAAGENTLIDGIRGGNEFRTGDWQGYYKQDIQAEVTFDVPKNLTEFGVSCIRDQRSWIFFPSSIQIAVSEDGVHFEDLPLISIEKASETDKNPMNAVFSVKYKERKVKAIRYSIKNLGNCPSWHLGAGNPTWLFVDELIFK